MNGGYRLCTSSPRHSSTRHLGAAATLFCAGCRCLHTFTKNSLKALAERKRTWYNGGYGREQQHHSIVEEAEGCGKHTTLSLYS